MTEDPKGTAVAYSSERGPGFAPFKGKALCISKSGRARPAHEYDRDGICYWCGRFDPKDWPEVSESP